MARVLMVTHVLPAPPLAGNEQRIYKLLRWMKQAGHEVHLLLRPLGIGSLEGSRLAQVEALCAGLHLYFENDGPGAYRPWRSLVRHMAWDPALHHLARTRISLPSRLTARRLAYLEELFCPDGLVEETRRLCEHLRAGALLSQYVWMSRCLSAAPTGVLRIIDTHDIFSARQEKVRAHGIPDLLSITPAEEASCLRRADLVLAIQDSEARALAGLGCRDVITVGIDFDVAVADAPGEPGRVLYAASDNAVNARGLQDFLAHAWPKVRARRPGALFHVVGPVCRHLPEGWANDPTVRALGLLPRSELEEQYRQAQVVINPAVAGTGLQVKTVEALGLGRPVVLWPNGAEGLADGAPCRVARDWPDFAEQVAQILGDRALFTALSTTARAYVSAHYGQDVVYGALDARLRRART